MASPLTEKAISELLKITNAPMTHVELNTAFRVLAKWRSHVIQNTLVRMDGIGVRAGPFKGTEYIDRSFEGCHVPKLLGCYEQPLHAAIEAAIARRPAVVINVGCSEGYYAVGLARRLPGARIIARDINEQGLAACRVLAGKNGVADQIETGGLFTPADFRVHAGAEGLVFCDIEGAERDLLDPDAAPALRGMEIIVEVHDAHPPELLNLIRQRFENTHVVNAITDDGMRRVENPPAWYMNLSHIDQLVAVWEWRVAPTPWLVMTPKGAV